MILRTCACWWTIPGCRKPAPTAKVCLVLSNHAVLLANLVVLVPCCTSPTDVLQRQSIFCSPLFDDETATLVRAQTLTACTCLNLLKIRKDSLHRRLIDTYTHTAACSSKPMDVSEMEVFKDHETKLWWKREKAPDK
jgi:hypothetical protein